ncbi:MAG: AAA family ATPase [Thermoleophilia bacterium]|nr:AAA family ATPase [Thermoleophilia bacterium]MDH4345975.1 AAA family ATPase [Thermoleophilia bacterium]MDH5332866.1 AAA family ATPase [Thermoleophilia bacterium]
MHLRTIKIRGFKSFPDPVEVKLEPGVAVVVGPNGSGKSNVADAIVWAAGSLTPSALRAEKPDDVLFAGGGDARPADHCDVELVFDNEDGGFGPGLDFTEVSIARRLIRGGEGQYLVNRTPVRRTDLVELLADVGLGGSMHSIVSQGKVDAVLASKPSDRRALVEEAAGLGKFKQRRHRAELKLARVAVQVERARDVEDEVRKRLRPLALQATAAERAEKLAVEIAVVRARLAELDLASIADRRTATDEVRQGAQLARRGTQERLRALLAERESAEEELSDAAGRREAALGALYRLEGAAERLSIRRETAAALATRLEEDVTEALRALAGRSDEAAQALEHAARVAAAEARDAAQASGQAAERSRHAHARLAAAERAAARDAEERLDVVRRERHALEAAFADAAGGEEGASRSLVALGSARGRLAARAENAASLAAEARAQLADAQARAARGEPRPSELSRAADEARAAARVAGSERDDVVERARSARDRLGALERALAEREGLPPAARALAEAGERLAISEVAVESGRERAVAAALGPRASAVLAADAQAGLDLLKRASDQGLGSLVVLAGRDPAAIVAGLPVVTLDELLDARAASVTEEGFGYDPERGELWFAGEAAEAVLLEMDARRAVLAEEVAALTTRAAQAEREATAAAGVAAAAETAYAAVAHLRERVDDPALLERISCRAAELEAQLERATALVARLEAPLAAQVIAGRDRSAALGDDLRRLAELEAEARRQAAAAATGAQAAEVVVARLGGVVAGVAVEGDSDREQLGREAREAAAAADEAARRAREAADRARAAEAAHHERAPRRVGADADLLRRLGAVATSLGATLERAAALADRFQAPVRARADAGATRASELGAELRRLGAAEVELRAAADEASERLTGIEVEIARLDGEAQEAQRRLDTAREGLPDDVERPQAPDGSRDELAARADRLETRREALGRVNPLAKEEYAAEKERLEELAAQRHDLEESLTELERLRDDLAETVTRRFDETFAAVSANFTEVSQTLFPGGEGRLRLVEPEEEGGEPGVEVELRPAGKRITRLSLLSGGEKALGAISFLFALFLAKPCPFYLLDEVEAALDDTNITRFVELLRRYADRAQFVVITHQKRTMEAADVLYGVTMGGDGISQVVSRRLPRHEHAAATA